MHVRDYFAGFAFLFLTTGLQAEPTEYAVDPAHSSVGFKISHMGLAWVHGRFDDFAGEFKVDPEDPSQSTFMMSIKTDSIDTNNKKRDDHLRSAEFLNVKEFPVMTFQSRTVKAVDGGLEITGDLTLHGMTNPVTLSLKGGKMTEFPRGTHRTGYSTDLVLKRSNYGMNTMVGPIGDDVHVSISFEGVKK